MATRLSITEAPASDLTETDGTHEFPLVITDERGNSIPRKVTLAALKEAIAAAGAGFQRTSTRYDMTSVTPAEVTLGTTPLSTQESPTSLIAYALSTSHPHTGDQTHTRLTDGQINLIQPGVWKITYHVQFFQRGNATRVNPRYRPILHFQHLSTIHANTSGYIRPLETGTYIPSVSTTLVYEFRTTRAEALTFQYSFLNTGSAGHTGINTTTIQASSALINYENYVICDRIAA